MALIDCAAISRIYSPISLIVLCPTLAETIIVTGIALTGETDVKQLTVDS